MTVCLDNKFPEFREEIINAIKGDVFFKDSVYEFCAVEGKEVGLIFEPRIDVTYHVSHNKELVGEYSKTFIFDKSYKFFTTTKGDWIKKFS